MTNQTKCKITDEIQKNKKLRLSIHREAMITRDRDRFAFLLRQSRRLTDNIRMLEMVVEWGKTDLGSTHFSSF